MIRLLGGSKCRYSGQGLKMAEGRAEGQPLLVQTRRTVTIILANPSVFGLIIGASQHAPSPRIALGKRRRGARGVIELLRAPDSRNPHAIFLH